MEQFEFTYANREDVERMLSDSPAGRNTSLIRWNHGMWIRFGNYDKQPPMAIKVNGNIVGLVFYSINKNKVANQYEIVVKQGETHKGYGEALWRYWISFVHKQGATHLKLSCTPESIKWHFKHGLVFWSIDNSGSLRSYQPLFDTVEMQCAWREQAIKEPQYAMPDAKQMQAFVAEMNKDRHLSENKRNAILQAIMEVGSAWLYPYLRGING